jgi:hypothetical protein
MNKRLVILLALFTSLNLLADPSGPSADNEPEEQEPPSQSQPIAPVPVAPSTQQEMAGTAAEDFRQIREEYNKRFDANGVLINDKKLRNKFIKKQDELGQKFRQEGKISKVMEVRNSFKKDLAFIVSIIQENGSFVGVMIERNKYDLKEDAASLRFFDVPLLQRGTVLMNYANVDVISFRAEALEAAGGGEVAVRYPTNFKNNTFGETRFSIAKNAEGNFAFLNSERAEFTGIDLHIWIKPFAGPNFGIDNVSFRSASATESAPNPATP